MRTAYSNGISSEEGGGGVWAKQGSRHEARSHFKWILYSFREWKRNSAFCTSYFFNRSFNHFFFLIPQVRFVVSRGAVIPRIFFENMFSGKKKNRKRKPNYRNRYTFQIYIQFSATFPISLTDFIHSVPSFNILFFFPRWLFETLFGVPEVSVGSRSNSRAEFTEESRAARHPLLFHAWETVRFPRGVGRPTRISIKRSRDA